MITGKKVNGYAMRATMAVGAARKNRREGRVKEGYKKGSRAGDKKDTMAV